LGNATKEIKGSEHLYCEGRQGDLSRFSVQAVLSGYFQKKRGEMNTSIKAILVFLVLMLGVSSAPAHAAATLPPDFAAPLNELKAELSGIQSDLAKQVFGILEISGVEKDGNAYAKQVKLFGKDATLFFMYGQKSNEQKGSVPVIAVMVPIDLTTTNLLGDSVPNMGLKNPLLCFAKEECKLFQAAMPASKQPLMRTIMPGAILAAKGVNLYGTLASGAIDIVNPPKDPFIGLAKGKGMYAVSVSINPSKPWDKPFGLANTVMAGGTIRLTKEGANKTTEAWGTAHIETKPFTMYFKKDTLSQSLGFDAKSASLEDFFLILKVAGDTLGLPKLPSVSLPLTMVKLENPVYQGYGDASAPLNFETMMFKGTRNVTGTIGELITHAKGTIFGQPVARINLNASKTGVTGDAGVDAKLGPLEAGSANFYLNVGLTTTPPPKMGLMVKSAVFGDLDLKAGTSGLELAVPADCPLRPIGFKAHISNLALTDFPIEPQFTDCYTQQIMGVINGTVAVASDVGETVANGAAETAKTLSEEAQKTYTALHVDRVAAWGPALATHAAEVRSAEDAVQAADQAVNAAGKLINDLGTEIGKLDDRIRDISNEIGKLLKKLWSFVSGQVKSLKKEKATKESERDQKRTEQAAAEQRKKQAEAVKAEANTALREIPGPNITGRVAELNQQMLGVQAQQEVQAHVATYAANLASDFKNPGKRKDILSGVDAKAFIDERKTQFTTDYPTLAKLMEKDSTGKTQMEQFVDGSKNALVVKAVSQNIEDETERKLRETVPTLPTMDFDVPVNIVYGEGSNARCLQAPALQQCTYANEQNKLVPCTGAQNQVFSFRAGGDLSILTSLEKSGWGYKKKTACMMFVKFPPGGATLGMQYLLKDCVDDMNWASWILSATKFFFDPIEGNFTAYFSNPENPNGFAACITATNDVLNFTSECSTQKGGTRWRLVPVGQAKSRQAPPVRAIKARGAKPSAVPPATTNLAPLQLR
jgi:hypothetical protein